MEPKLHFETLEPPWERPRAPGPLLPTPAKMHQGTQITRKVSQSHLLGLHSPSKQYFPAFPGLAHRENGGVLCTPG